MTTLTQSNQPPSKKGRSRQQKPLPLLLPSGCWGTWQLAVQPNPLWLEGLQAMTEALQHDSLHTPVSTKH